MFLDIHSHILPSVDDGAQSIEESIKLLNSLKNQGVTAVLATPHFYPQDDNLTEFLKKTKTAFSKLSEATSNQHLPKILFGTEMLYFKGISNSTSLKKLCLNKSRFLLLELVDCIIDEPLFEEIVNLSNNLGIIPIIAHVERYHKAKKYNKFLKFIKKHNILTQVNSDSLFYRSYRRTIKKIFKMDIVTFLGSDCHSPVFRPPMLNEGLEFIEKKFGKDISDKLVENSNWLYNEITSSGEYNA